MKLFNIKYESLFMINFKKYCALLKKINENLILKIHIEVEDEFAVEVDR